MAFSAVAVFLVAAALGAEATTIAPDGETAPVATLEDAADDPAIWIHPTDPARSLILGTDKGFGLRVYDLDGTQRQSLPIGRLNNVDLRQGLALRGWNGDLAAASNRSDNTVVLFSVTEDGAEELTRFATSFEPYGLCMGMLAGEAAVFVTHKNGVIAPFMLRSLKGTPRFHPPYTFSSQLEGCVFDDAAQILYVGEENVGIWRMAYRDGAFAEPDVIDRVGGETGLTADVEGLSLVLGNTGMGAVLVASSQGDDSFHLYDVTQEPPVFVRKVRIGINVEAGIDGAQETDGIDVTRRALGPAFPNGLLVVQDGFNVTGDLSQDGRTQSDEPLAPQNFKLIDAAKLPDPMDP